MTKKFTDTPPDAYERGFNDCRTGLYQTIREFSESIKEFDDSGTAITWYLALYILKIQAPDYEDTLP